MVDVYMHDCAGVQAYTEAVQPAEIKAQREKAVTLQAHFAGLPVAYRAAGPRALAPLLGLGGQKHIILGDFAKLNKFRHCEEKWRCS